MRELTQEDSHPIRVDIDDDGDLNLRQLNGMTRPDNILLGREQMRQLHALLGALLKMET